MLFHTPQFFLLFVTCFLIYPWLRRQGQNGLLLAANVVFYLASGLVDSTIFAFVLVLNYLLARRIAGKPDWRTLFAAWAGANLILFASNFGLARILGFVSSADLWEFQGFRAPEFLLWNAVIGGWTVCYFILTRLPARVSVWAVVALNLANLATFKYANFLLGNAGSITALLGSAWVPPQYDLWLPLGISFYSFQVMAYQIDLARGSATPPRHFGEFMLFISFFPQLIAGPILRSHEFLPQITERRQITMSDVKLGALFILWGLVKKVVFGDTLANIVDPYFEDVSILSGVDAWIAAVGFSFQIYFDFSGYSDIAVGLGHAFGLRLPRNFHQPYLSRDPREFWQRWHVTLSRWLRDYLYITLGGNRGTRLATLRNLMLTMLLGGLWHGASWTFVCWGAFHGLLLAAERARGIRARGRHERPPRGAALAARIVWTNLLVTFGWVLFRADTLGQAGRWWSAMLGLQGLDLGTLPHHVPVAAAVAVPVALVACWVVPNTWQWRPAPTVRWTVAVAAVAVAAVSVVFANELSPFLYFQF